LRSSVVFKSETVEWSTPKAVYEKLHAEFDFNFDPCPLGGSENGLALLFCEWKGRRVFCNPPYGDISQWLRRGREADIAVFLIPARTDTRWFHDLILPFAREIRFIRGRLKFGESANNAPFPSMVVVFQAGETGVTK
jgi:site-specific DNA-methyltransferase (adenine-specific)